MKRKGIVLAGGSGTRLYPLTISVTKQLMAVYDKPMIYYPLSVLMLAGIQEVLIISTPQDKTLFENLLGDGSRFGIKIEFAVQEKPEGLAQAFLIGEDFLNGSPAALILGDNLFYGSNFHHQIRTSNAKISGAGVFGYYVSNPCEYGVVEFNDTGKVISLEEKPKHPKSNYAVPGIYFYDESVCEKARNLKPSSRGELEITDLNKVYLKEDSLDVSILSRGTAWLDTGTHDSLLEASNFVQVVEKRQGLKVACLEEIAYLYGWITDIELQCSIDMHAKTQYASYLIDLKNREYKL
jgi:glucose-1-phosphate thymidylyltransferase